MTANKLKMNDDKTVSKLIRWCSEPSQTKRIISRLKTNFNLSPSHSLHKSSYHKSLFPKPQLRLYPQFRNASPENNNNNTCSGAYLYSAGTQHGNLHSASWPIFFGRPTQEPVLATDSTGKTRGRFGEKCRWRTGKVDFSKDETPGSKRSMCGYVLTYSRL